MNILNWIKKLIDDYKKKAELRNEECDSIITELQNAQKQIEDMFAHNQQDIIDASIKVDAIKDGNELLFKVDASTSRLRRATRFKALRNQFDHLQQMIHELPLRISKHNSNIWNARIDEAYQTIGTVEGIQLDKQQMKCIIKDVHNHLVLAGAGTGKTTTIVGKIKYMLKKNMLKPEDILVLSFTNASATEMSQRINKETGCKIDASTFHKLGLNILTKANGVVPKITTIQMRGFLKEQLNKNIQDPEYARKLGSYLLFNRIDDKSEFDFSSDEEYKEYLRLNPPKTVKGEDVKSYGELEIANFLYQNGIEYEYERHYEVDTATEEYGQYNPDFYLPEYGIYIEYFGIDKNGNVPDFFSKRDGMSASESYRAAMAWKKKLHEENGTKLVECYAYEKIDDILLESLQSKLAAYNVIFKPISNEELWKHISDDKDGMLDCVIELIETVINLMKSNRYTIDDIRRLNPTGRGHRSTNLLIDIIEPIFNAYCEHLSKNNEIDFNDMINTAIDAVENGKYHHEYKLVIVDEYQDISKSRFNLLNSMRKQKDYDLFCVGDDWQSIYRFAGSDIGFILNFEKYWGPTEISKIETTYRFSQSLIDVSGTFVMSNPEQIKKSIKGKAADIGFSIGEVCGYTEEYAVKFMAERIRELPQNASVFFIGRYSFDSKILENGNIFKCKYNNVSGVVDVTYDKRKDLKMSFITAHKSKGLQADYVFIINNKKGRMGFPSRIHNARIIDLLLEDCDTYPFAEERRLFYVALTRARKKALLMTIANQESIFAGELKDKYGKQMKREAFECPLCGGYLEKKNGPYGEFFGCSNYRTTGCGFTRKIQKQK